MSVGVDRHGSTTKALKCRIYGASKSNILSSTRSRAANVTISVKSDNNVWESKTVSYRTRDKVQAEYGGEIGACKLKIESQMKENTMTGLPE